MKRFRLRIGEGRQIAEDIDPLRNAEGLPDDREIMDREREGPIQVEHPMFPRQDGFCITGPYPASHEFSTYSQSYFSQFTRPPLWIRTIAPRCAARKPCCENSSFPFVIPLSLAGEAAATLAGGIGFTALGTDPNLPLLEFPVVLDDPYGSAGEHIPACPFDAFQQKVKGELPFRRQPHIPVVNIMSSCWNNIRDGFACQGGTLGTMKEAIRNFGRENGARGNTSAPRPPSSARRVL